MERKAIETLDDVKSLVNNFYGQVQKDDLIGPIFNSIIDDWTPHLEKMYQFWQTVLLGEHTYYGRPFPPHIKLDIDRQHFDRWKSLFFNTVDTHFIGEKAEEAKWRAERMAEMFYHKKEYIKANNSKPIL